jgi:hypothetical protein
MAPMCAAQVWAYDSYLIVEPDPSGAALGKISCRAGYYDGYHDISHYVWIGFMRNGSVVASGWEETQGPRVDITLNYTVGDQASDNYTCEAHYYLDTLWLGYDSDSIGVGVPDGQSVTYDAYNYQFFKAYERERHLQVQAGGQSWPFPGSTVTEPWTDFSPNQCLITTHATSEAETNTIGQYLDRYSLSFPPGTTQCDVNPTCISSAIQTINVGGYQAKQYSVDYGCYSVTIN